MYKHGELEGRWSWVIYGFVGECVRKPIRKVWETFIDFLGFGVGDDGWVRCWHNVCCGCEVTTSIVDSLCISCQLEVWVVDYSCNEGSHAHWKLRLVRNFP